MLGLNQVLALAEETNEPLNVKVYLKFELNP